MKLLSILLIFTFGFITGCTKTNTNSNIFVSYIGFTETNRTYSSTVLDIDSEITKSTQIEGLSDYIKLENNYKSVVILNWRRLEND